MPTLRKSANMQTFQILAKFATLLFSFFFNREKPRVQHGYIERRVYQSKDCEIVLNDTAGGGEPKKIKFVIGIGI